MKCSCQRAGVWLRRCLMGVVVIIAVLFLYRMVSFMNRSYVRTEIEKADHERFARVVGFRPDEILFVDALRPGFTGTPGHVAYGAIVPEFQEDGLADMGWVKADSLADAQISPGTKFKVLSNYNHNLYVRNKRENGAVMICSPYGDDKYLGRVAYLVVVSAEYNAVVE